MSSAARTAHHPATAATSPALAPSEYRQSIPSGKAPGQRCGAGRLLRRPSVAVLYPRARTAAHASPCSPSVLPNPSFAVGVRRDVEPQIDPTALAAQQGQCITNIGKATYDSYVFLAALSSSTFL